MRDSVRAFCILGAMNQTSNSSLASCITDANCGQHVTFEYSNGSDGVGILRSVDLVRGQAGIQTMSGQPSELVRLSTVHLVDQPPAACEVAHTPIRKYTIRPYHRYINYSTGEKEQEVSGWDVWEFNGRSEVIVDPCDSREAAEAALDMYRNLYGVEAVT